MGKFDSIMICSDFDNTLTARDFKVPNNKCEFNIPPNNFEAVKYFVKEGGKFVMASGRNPDELEPLKKYMPIYDVAICTNGSLYSFDKKEVVYSVTLKDEFFEDVKRIMQEFPLRNWRVTDADFVNFGWDIGDGDCYEELKKRKAPFYKISFWGREDREYCARLIAYLKETYSSKYIVEASAPNFFEMYDKKGGKDKAVLRLKELTNSKKVIAIGDQENDLLMLSCADVGVCVGDGSSEAKSVAKVLCAPSYKGAIADVIDMLDKNLI